MISFLRYWLPLLLWMLVIFGASADTQSTEHTSRFLEPFLRWLIPNISARTVEHVRWVVRKSAHMTEFALLAWLWWRALRKPKRHDARPWSWKPAVAALGIAILYAAADEFHQRFVASRTPSVRDVCIDTAGAALGIGILWLCHRRRKHN
jgi:VanZ family protein